MVYDMRLVADDDSDLDTTLVQYARVDGSNDSEFVYGTAGSDNATMRLGDDTYIAGAGNDLLVGHGGADSLNGGEGNDYFLITGFGSGNQGTTSKADDGAPEWITTGAKRDVIIGGDGVDTLRITGGVGGTNSTTGKIVLNDTNFKGMEVVEVGALVGRINTEDSALQLINGHYYLNKTGTVADVSAANVNNGGSINNVVIDASGVTTNGLRFEGNANTQTFIGTIKNDVFVNNGGNDTLTGGKGNDLFVFNKVQQQTVIASSDTTLPSAYAVVTSTLTGTDTITDFTRGKDKIGLGLDMFTGYTKAGGIGADTIVVGAGAVALDANDYLIFDTTTKTLKFDADGSGAGAEVDIAILTGVTTLTTSGFTLV